MTKYAIIAGVILVLYLGKKKRDKEKEDKLFEEALKNNETPCDEKINEIRLRIDEWMKFNMPFIRDDELMDIVVDLTTNLENIVIPNVDEEDSINE